MQIDDQDRRLLRQYQADPAAPVSVLAMRCGMTRAAAWRRLEKLREAGIARGVRTLIDWSAVGFAVEVSLRITVDKSRPEAFDAMIAAARQIPEVVEIQTFLGRVDLRLSVIARDMADWQQIYRERILTLPHVADIESLMRVATIKQDERLPL